jgi:hypothetical protein
MTSVFSPEKRLPANELPEDFVNIGTMKSDKVFGLYRNQRLVSVRR